MAIRKRVGKTGTRWLVDYYDSNGKRRFITCQSQREAKDKEAELRSRRAKGDIIVPSKMTFGELADGWVERKGLKPSTARAWVSCLNRHLLPVFGKKKIQGVTRAEIKVFASNMRKNGLSHSTTKNILTILRLLLEDAVEQNLLLHNPCSKLKVPKIAADHSSPVSGEESNFSPLSETETQLFTKTTRKLYPTPSPLGALFTLAVFSGLRRGELMGLTWGDLQLDSVRPTLRVQRSWDRKEGFITPKSPNACREVPVLPEALKTLKEWRLASKNKANDSRVFPVDPDGFRSQFKRVLRKVKLRDIRFHDLRGTYASILANRNVPPKVLQRIMGHANFAITMDVYAKFTRDDTAILDTALVGFGDS
jgi:integrase